MVHNDYIKVFPLGSRHRPHLPAVSLRASPALRRCPSYLQKGPNHWGSRNQGVGPRLSPVHPLGTLSTAFPRKGSGTNCKGLPRMRVRGSRRRKWEKLQEQKQEQGWHRRPRAHLPCMWPWVPFPTPHKPGTEVTPITPALIGGGRRGELRTTFCYAVSLSPP